MKPRMIFLSVAVILGVLLGAAIPLPALQAQGAERQQRGALATLPVVDDFESGLPAGTDANGIADRVHHLPGPEQHASPSRPPLRRRRRCRARRARTTS